MILDKTSPKGSRIKTIHKRDLSKIRFSSHSDFSGLHQCYAEAFKAIHNTRFFRLPPPCAQESVHLKVLFDPNDHTQFSIADQYDLLLAYQVHGSLKITLDVHTYPEDAKLQQQFQYAAQIEFFTFLQSHSFNINKLNPAKLLSLINQHIHPKILLNFNKKHTSKVRKKLSLEGLAKLLNSTHAKLNNRNRKISGYREALLKKITLESKLAEKLINDVKYCPTAEDFWRT